MKSTAFWAGACCSAVIVAASLAMPAWAAGKQVTVARGGGDAIEAASVTKEGGVTVHRGPAVSRQAAAAADAPAARIRAVAGEDIWLLDPESNRLIACRLQKTAFVGQSVVACARRSLTSITQ